jgi:hypothetical protein
LTELWLQLLYVVAQCCYEGLPRGEVLKEKNPSCLPLAEKPPDFASLLFHFLFDSKLGGWQGGVCLPVLAAVAVAGSRSLLHLSFTALLVKVAASFATQTLSWSPVVCPEMAKCFTFMAVLTFK